MMRRRDVIGLLAAGLAMAKTANDLIVELAPQ
jgi:hypothetical protein